MSKRPLKFASLAFVTAMRAGADALDRADAFGKSFAAMEATDEHGDRVVIVVAHRHRADDLADVVKDWGGKPQKLSPSMQRWWKA